MKMEQYELQSYFESLCNSFYIAYQQEKRLEKERLEAVQEEYKREYDKWDEIILPWLRRRSRIYSQIEVTVKEIAKKKYSIIITSEAEIYALMKFYANNHAAEYPIINEEEQYRKLFPEGKAVYMDFLTAYHYDLTTITGNGSKMEEMYHHYF